MDNASLVDRSPTPSTKGTRVGTWLGRVTVAIWIPGLLVVLGSLMAGHWIALPRPRAGDPDLGERLSAVRTERGREGWAGFHVLYGSCPCSRRVLDHVEASERAEGLAEFVLFVGDDPDFVDRCKRRGFEVVELGQDDLEQQFGILAAPMFVVIDPDGQVVYAGGYTGRKQGLDFRDLGIVARLRAGEAVEPLPVYGCGVSTSLQDALDPIGIKY